MKRSNLYAWAREIGLLIAILFAVPVAISLDWILSRIEDGWYQVTRQTHLFRWRIVAPAERVFEYVWVRYVRRRRAAEVWRARRNGRNDFRF